MESDNRKWKKNCEIVESLQSASDKKGTNLWQSPAIKRFSESQRPRQKYQK
jgi:hypothetical protein